jgi:N-acyl-D-amino-acid deacylase
MRGVLTLEDAVRRMTSLPARTFNLQDRGQLKPGMAADLVVFDPVRVQDQATFAKPHQYSEGFDFVLVNGKIAVDEGKLTSERGGNTLRH